MTKQMTIIFEDQPKPALQAKDLPFGQLFQYGPDKRLLVRVKPVNYILNSTLVTDCINRNKVFVVGVDKGTLFIIEGNAEVVPMKSELRVKGRAS